jgi:hypothetical protein
VSYSRKQRKGLAKGVFLVLSIVVFGSMFCVAYSAMNVKLIASEGDAGDVVGSQGFAIDGCEYLVSVDPEIESYHGLVGSSIYASGLHMVSVPF